VSNTVQLESTPTQVIVEQDVVRVVAEQTSVRVVSAGVQGPAGGSGPLRTANPTWAATMALDWSNADVVRITLAGNTTFTFTGAQNDQRLMLELTQDATGGRSVTWPANLRYSGTIPAIALSTAGGRLDRIGFIYRAGTNTYDVIAIAIGFI
jgi:hypothetical protein